MTEFAQKHGAALVFWAADGSKTPAADTVMPQRASARAEACHGRGADAMQPRRLRVSTVLLPHLIMLIMAARLTCILECGASVGYHCLRFETFAVAAVGGRADVALVLLLRLLFFGKGMGRAACAARRAPFKFKSEDDAPKTQAMRLSDYGGKPLSAAAAKVPIRRRHYG